MVEYIGNLRIVQRVRPLNMTGKDPHFADDPKRIRCPRCNQFHLRAGYCQALDVDRPEDVDTQSLPVDKQTLSVDKDVDRVVSVDKPVDIGPPVDTEIEPDEEEIDKAERRRRQQRDWARRKRGK